MPCLDTTFIIDYLRGTERAKIQYDVLRDEKHGEPSETSTSIVTAYELRKAARCSKNSVRDLEQISELLTEFRILNLDNQSIDLAAEIYSKLRRKGSLIGEFDILIAASCIANNQSLVTNDPDYDQITELTKIHY